MERDTDYRATKRTRYENENWYRAERRAPDDDYGNIQSREMPPPWEQDYVSAPLSATYPRETGNDYPSDERRYLSSVRDLPTMPDLDRSDIYSRREALISYPVEENKYISSVQDFLDERSAAYLREPVSDYPSEEQRYIYSVRDIAEPERSVGYSRETVLDYPSDGQRNFSSAFDLADPGRSATYSRETVNDQLSEAQSYFPSPWGVGDLERSGRDVQRSGRSMERSERGMPRSKNGRQRFKGSKSDEKSLLGSGRYLHGTATGSQGFVKSKQGFVRSKQGSGRGLLASGSSLKVPGRGLLSSGRGLLPSPGKSLLPSPGKGLLAAPGKSLLATPRSGSGRGLLAAPAGGSRGKGPHVLGRGSKGSGKGSQAPGKGSKALGKGPQAPGKGSQVPGKGSQAPAKNSQASAKDSQEPVKGSQAAAKDSQASAKDSQASGVNQAPVIDLTTSPTENSDKGSDSVSSNTEKSASQNKVLTPKVYSKCTLHPPRSGIVQKPKMERPLGCKTVTISGLPKTLGFDILREVFGACGNIRNLIRRKNESHFRVTYVSESSIDKVIEINGYTLVGSGKGTLKGLQGTIKVEYVEIWVERLEHMNRMKKQQKEVPEEPTVKPKASVSTTSQSELSVSKEAILKLEKEYAARSLVKGDVRDHKANVLIRWMEEGACNKDNCHLFLRVLNEMHNSLDRIMKSLDSTCTSNCVYFAEILKAFQVAHEKISSNFSINIRKRIEKFKRITEEAIESNSQCTKKGKKEKGREIVEEKTGNGIASQSSAIEQMVETESLKAEIELLKKELEEAKNKALEKSNSQVTPTSDENSLLKQKDIENENLKAENEKLKKELVLGQIEALRKNGPNPPEDNHTGEHFIEKEARLIAAIGAFLNLYRFGENIANIHNYLAKLDPSVTIEDIRCLMRKLPSLFKEELVEGDDAKSKWTLLGM